MEGVLFWCLEAEGFMVPLVLGGLLLNLEAANAGSGVEGPVATAELGLLEA